MELLKLSKFKLQLNALISEVKQLKDKERSANDQVQLMIQKQKQREEEFGRKITDLQAELCLSYEIRRKLEKKVNFLESENGMFEDKQKELKETITGLLQSKDSFVQVYEDSFGGMKRAVKDRDQKISILSEKIKAHTLLFDTIEKDANSIKQVVDNADRFTKERDEVVAGFKRKLDEVLTWEKLFFEKINNLESQLKDCQEELKRKDKNILVLEAHLEAASFCKDFHPRIDQLQNALSAKELIIQNLVLERQALQFEVGNLGFAMKKIQDAMSHMDQEDKKAFSLTLDEPEECVAIRGDEVNCLEDVGTNEGVSCCNTFIEDAIGNSVLSCLEAALPECQRCSTSTIKPLKEGCGLDSSVYEAAYLATQSISSQPQIATNAVSLSTAGAKDASTKSLDQLDSESQRSQSDNS